MLASRRFLSFFISEGSESGLVILPIPDFD